MSNDPYAGSPYDAAGMPLGTTVADYDNAEERRKNQVKTHQPAEPVTVFDLDYTPEETEADKAFKKARPETEEEKAEFEKGFNGALQEGVNVPGMDQVSIEEVIDNLFEDEKEQETPKEKGDDSVPDPKKEEEKK